ncbi:toxin-antitoxin system YwqK family antitoxin [Jejuia spongiicola]|uniref:Toxin-antitoxin system YwqK family antitoxin n=1 Tax=Jejuia spongiicola TaxID=2942207 RepID=A0ABT0QCM7_9FLAO|nr:toxin-antitoxin system YwqK family antitoxin [Jejuia spongiicola]MCL6294639.1 toxin-antitoxin system YwqK family antitoxin [Jejuia spongiicola]
MKHIFIFLLSLLTSLTFAQNINQFDANGKRHGIWKKTFDGTKVLRYEGEFLHGKEIGLFKFYKNIKKKAVLTATKQFNKTDNIAYVTFLSSRGKLISEGKMDKKKYIGEWKYYQKRNDNLLTLENYNANGILEGERFVYYENGQIAEKQFYKNGKLEGKSIWYSEKNIVLKEFIYLNGELHGASKYYNPKGELITEGQYKKGKKHGIWKYYENGKLIKEKDFTYKPKYIKNKQ